MRGTFWKRGERQLQRALAHAGAAVVPEQSAEAIICDSLQGLCGNLHVPGCKFLEIQENITPDFEFFDLTRTTAPTDSNNLHTDHAGRPLAPIADAHQVLREKTKFCALVSSNPYCATRNRLLTILAQYHLVDSAGPALPNRPIVPRPSARTVEFYHPYKFVLAIENSLALDYASEKLWHALSAHTVPIYWGNPQIANYFNPERFINAFDFDTLESLAAHVMRVHENDELYLRYLSAPNTTPRQRAKRFIKQTPANSFSMITSAFHDAREDFLASWKDLSQKTGKEFFEQYVRVMTGRRLPLAQRRMFHRECLSRFAHEACDQIVEDRVHLAGWARRDDVSRRVNVTSRGHVWPHSAFYEAVDMAGQLSAKG